MVDKRIFEVIALQHVPWKFNSFGATYYCACLGRSARFVFMPVADTVYYLLGSGEYDELACKYDPAIHGHAVACSRCPQVGFLQACHCELQGNFHQK